MSTFIPFTKAERLKRLLEIQTINLKVLNLLLIQCSLVHRQKEENTTSMCSHFIQLCLPGITTTNPKQSRFTPIKATKQQWSTQQWKSPRKIRNPTSLRWCIYRLGWGKVCCDVYKHPQWTRGLPSLSSLSHHSVKTREASDGVRTQRKQKTTLGRILLLHKQNNNNHISLPVISYIQALLQVLLLGNVCRCACYTYTCQQTN